eukprot:GCRY01002396.1.p1 GENE.GCRY01002396.1~~GCRY01002396.1.p1  ORF type:complete len:781 (+),score=200.82 GCRY01002396.1:185-2527(+)
MSDSDSVDLGSSDSSVDIMSSSEDLSDVDANEVIIDSSDSDSESGEETVLVKEVQEEKIEADAVSSDSSDAEEDVEAESFQKEINKREQLVVETEDSLAPLRSESPPLDSDNSDKRVNSVLRTSRVDSSSPRSSLRVSFDCMPPQTLEISPRESEESDVDLSDDENSSTSDTSSSSSSVILNDSDSETSSDDSVVIKDEEPAAPLPQPTARTTASVHQVSNFSASDDEVIVEEPSPKPRTRSWARGPQMAAYKSNKARRETTSQKKEDEGQTIKPENETVLKENTEDSKATPPAVPPKNQRPPITAVAQQHEPCEKEIKRTSQEESSTHPPAQASQAPGSANNPEPVNLEPLLSQMQAMQADWAEMKEKLVLVSPEKGQSTDVSRSRNESQKLRSALKRSEELLQLEKDNSKLLEKEVERLNNQLARSENAQTIRDLRLSQRNLCMSVEILKEKLKCATEEKDDLANKNFDLKTERDKLARQLADSEYKVRDLRQRLGQDREHFKRRKEEHEKAIEASAVVSTLTQELAAVRAELEIAVAEKRELEDAAEQRIIEHETMTARIEDLMADKEALQLQNDDLTTQLRQSVAECDVLRAQAEESSGASPNQAAQATHKVEKCIKALRTAQKSVRDGQTGSAAGAQKHDKMLGKIMAELKRVPTLLGQDLSQSTMNMGASQASLGSLPPAVDESSRYADYENDKALGLTDTITLAPADEAQPQPEPAKKRRKKKTAESTDSPTPAKPKKKRAKKDDAPAATTTTPSPRPKKARSSKPHSTPMQD